ncbi:uncharacterized protein KY384_008867 [Bacidia gigantensis]|uniref:uncharacterized protein n=1 Tax=Bacidia gigantensis TaxID=2732470 RepID=UPI001D04A84B|nr:uncharacterized protein KY384_008867 [Bacidia gigantensis]KAG8525223.1 hypothetical protein KY384_008867 [Bacidia gigantensis]
MEAISAIEQIMHITPAITNTVNQIIPAVPPLVKPYCATTKVLSQLDCKIMTNPAIDRTVKLRYQGDQLASSPWDNSERPSAVGLCPVDPSRMHHESQSISFLISNENSTPRVSLAYVLDSELSFTFEVVDWTVNDSDMQKTAAMDSAKVFHAWPKWGSAPHGGLEHLICEREMSIQCIDAVEQSIV